MVETTPEEKPPPLMLRVDKMAAPILSCNDHAPAVLQSLNGKDQILQHLLVLASESLKALEEKLIDPLNSQDVKPVPVLGIALSQVQDFALGLVKLHEVCTSPPVKSIKFPLGGIPSLQHIDHEMRARPKELTEISC
ncbi:hypothetical protein BTVI_41917 [Pitangus sulphuratus]|nr:hypothetical protein BTVI_41917 [Pitangus sulphuratus]